MITDGMCLMVNDVTQPYFEAEPPWRGITSLMAELVRLLICVLGSRSWVPWCRLIGIATVILVWWSLLYPHRG